MNPFGYRDGVLCAESVSLATIATSLGTPCFVYSRAALTAAYAAYSEAFAETEPLICYAAKANSNLAILGLFAQLGSGFDIVSGGELARVLAAGGAPGRVVFSGVGKSEAEMRFALTHDILCFNIESSSELERLNRVAAAMNKVAPVSFRVNPDVDPGTHPYISTGLKDNKFGIPHGDAVALYLHAQRLSNVRIVGIDCHIGSQITEIAPYLEAFERILELVAQLGSAGIVLEHIDLGGGIGIRYRDEEPLSLPAYARAIGGRLAGRRERLILEPGRSLVGNGGLLLTRVEYLKHGETRNFAVVDAAMNDLMRPALYDAYHSVLPVAQHADAAADVFDIVGPVCESGDFLARDRELALAEGDLIAIMSAGAYGMSMSSNYNTRPRAAEVMADGSVWHVIRDRETIPELFAREHPLP
ncbi:MAG: diaminopimelate decarboxylase [Betaproteobacteria bacterium]|nr:diaminopimelate decarboxylase [Betaproteobacteria bacterium]